MVDEVVPLGQGENILRFLTHHRLVAGPQQGGALLDDIHLLLLGFGLQQVGGAFVGCKYLTPEL